jgi:hypothetical protein
MGGRRQIGGVGVNATLVIAFCVNCLWVNNKLNNEQCLTNYGGVGGIIIDGVDKH